MPIKCDGPPVVAKLLAVKILLHAAITEMSYTRHDIVEAVTSAAFSLVSPKFKLESSRTTISYMFAFT